MERTDRLTRITSLVLFVALLAYVGFYLLRSVTNPVVTALAVSTTVTDSTTVSGVVVREEQYLKSNESNVSVSAADGQHVSAGEQLALVLDSKAALESMSRQKELELEIAREEALLSSASGNTGEGESSARKAVRALSASIAVHSMQEIESACMSLDTLLFSGGSGQVTQESLNALKQQLSSLQNTGVSVSAKIGAPVSGTFTAMMDGYEQFSLSDLKGATPSGLRTLMQTRQDPPQDAFGKLITSYIWYYAAIMRISAAEEIQIGDVLALDFGRYYSEPVSARVLELGPVEGEERVVVFSCGSALADTLQMRHVSAEIVKHTYTGIRVPAEAIHQEDGETYVYTMTALQAEKKAVEILYQGEEFCVVKDAPDANALREGNEVIVKAKNLYDGKVMGG